VPRSLPFSLSWTRKLLPRTLRARLILSFGLLIFLTLFMAATSTIYLLKQQQERSARERVGLLAAPVAKDAASLEAQGVSDAAEILNLLQTAYGGFGVRILLLDRDAVVVEDTGQTLRDATINQLRQQGVPAQPLDSFRYRVSRYREGPDSLLIFSSNQGVTALLASPSGVGVPRYQAVVAVDESAVSEAWHNLVPRFFMAGGVAFLVSVVAAGLLARGITRPLRRITEASEDMARGRYDQTIPSYGGEEVSRLAKAFNEMAYQVSRSHRTLRDFLANVSHELKTPLTSVQGFSQAMVDGSLQRPEDFAEAGRIINDEAVRMRALVDDLLYLSQVEAGEIVMHFDRLDPNEVLQVTRERLARRADQAGVDLVVQPAYTPQIRADGRRLEQALLNIAENAVRHTPAGGRVTMRSAANNGNVRLAVHNTGSLIPPESLPLLFDRFYQAKQDFSRTQGTTGLGLAITKEIVEAHGGEIAVTSTMEQGTEFVITLPVEQTA
jgi:signal transduction histidine kinase